MFLPSPCMHHPMNWLKALKFMMVFIAFFHLVAGLGLMFSVTFQVFAASAYGAVLWRPDFQNIYFTRILGSFAFVLGTMAFAAALDPLRYRAIVIGFVEFFILRNIHRHLYSNELISGFGISRWINDLTSLFFGVQAAILIILLCKCRAQSNISSPTGV